MSKKTKSKKTGKDQVVLQSTPTTQKDLLSEELQITKVSIPKTYASRVGSKPKSQISTPEIGSSQPHDAMWFMKIVQTDEFSKIQAAIFSIRVDKLASRDNNDFLKTFLVRFDDLGQREKIANNVLDKILIYSEGVPSLTPRINLLKANILTMQAQNSLDKIIQNNQDPTVLTEARKAILSAETAYKICYDNIRQPDYGDKKLLEITNIQNDIIRSVTDSSEQFGLLELALNQRKLNLPGNDLCLVDLLIILGEFGSKFTDFKLKAAVMNHNIAAYNILADKKELTKEQVSKLDHALRNLASMALEFSDIGKAALFYNHLGYTKSYYLKEDVKSSKLIKSIDKDKDKEDYTSSQLSMYLPILKSGIVTESILEVKKAIQKSVLNPVHDASARGKWTEVTFTGDWGVGGYLTESWLKKQMGQLFNKNTYEIALKLCFEAISIGIVNAKEFNPLCAAIFCQKYPKIADSILQDNPEYFVDGSIIITSILDADKYSTRLFDLKIEANSNYNYHFEELVTPIVTGRIKDSILAPIEKIVKDGEWSIHVEKALMGLLQDRFIKKAIGANWSEIIDLPSIVRIIAFNKLTEAIDTYKSTNFSCINSFIKAYPELVKRILANHKESLSNGFIFKSLEEAQIVISEPASIEETSQSYVAEIPALETPVDKATLDLPTSATVIGEPSVLDTA